MGETFQKRISALLLSNRRHARWAAMVACMAVLVAFGVTVGLTQKGQAKTHEETVLDCQYSGNGAHTHDASCYDADGNLVCPLEEREWHVHDDSCYASETYLVCGLEEGEGAHAHDESCYDEEGNLVCGLEESAGHVHDDSCWQTDTYLACGKDEVAESHTHGDACFKTIVVEDGEEEPAAAEAEPVAEAEPEAEAEAEAAKDAEKPAAKATTATEPAKATTADNGEQTFAGELKDADGNVVLAVSVKAPKGALPEGATMRVKPIDAVEVAGKVNEAVQADAGEGKVAKSIMAVDIAFLDKDGNEVEPSEKVEVKITTALVRDVDAPALVHIDEKSDVAEVVHGTAKVNADEKDTTTGNEDTLKFDTDKFSPYIVVEIGDAEEQPAEAEPAVAMPAQSFEGKAGDVTVKVSAPEGAFAEGTTMAVEAVKADDVIESIEGAVTGDVRQVAAVDITFADAEGNQVQPLVPIKVTMTNAAAPAKSEPTVVHVDDEGEASVVEQSMITSASDEVVFDADSFSVYAMVITTQYISASGDAYDVTVTYGPEAGIPEGAWLSVSEFEEGSEEWVNARNAVIQTKAAHGEFINEGDLGFAALDISIMDADGNEIEPEAEVQVDLSIKALPNVDDLSELGDDIEIQHHVETSDGVIVDTVATGAVAGEFALPTDASVISDNASIVVNPESFVDDEIDDTSVEASFTVDEFSTYSITWGSSYNRKSTTVHYGYMNGNNFVEFTEQPSPVNVSTSYRTYLIYDFDGYEYSGYTYYRTNTSSTPASGGTRIQAQLRYSDSNWRYHAHSTSDSDRNWTSLANDSHIYVVYKQKPAPTTGGTPEIKEIEPSDWPQKPDTPQFYKSSTSNGNGTNTVSLSITGGEKDYEQATKANVIVVFDVSGSMTSDLNGRSRLYRAQAAVNRMADTLLNGSITGVKMALVTFSTTSSATPAQGFTDNYTTYTNAVNRLSAEGGTNWEQALYNANRLEVDQDAATFVVFVTDGDPTYRLSRYGAPDREIQGYGRDSRYFEYDIFGAGSSDPNDRDFDAAAEEVESILANNKTFYAIGVSNEVTKVQNLVDEAGGGTAYLATDSDALDEAFAHITESIKTKLGFGDVEITDGITELANVEMKVMQEVDPESFTYYKVTSAGQAEWDPASEGAGLASYDKNSGAVTWNLGEGFQLEEGVTYMVTFRAWPSQEAYDLVADLNNGVKVYEAGHDNSISEEERTQVVERSAPTEDEQGIYTLKTNTDNVHATYSQTSTTGETVTVSGETGLVADYHEGTLDNMALTSELLTIRKIFDQSLDPRTVESVTLKLQRKVNDDDHTMADYNVPGTSSPNIVLSDDNKWQYSFYVAPGFIVDGKTLEKGYQFTVTEPDLGENTVRYDLIPEIVNPMVVDGTLELIGDGDDNQALTAINRTRSAVEIHKTLYDVDGTTKIYPDTEFTITGRLLGPDGTPFTSQETAAPVAYYLYDKDGNATTGRMHFPTTQSISFTLKAGEFIRFVNVPEGCTFEFTEGTMPDNYEFKSLAAVGRQRAETDPAYTYSIELSDAEAHLVESTASIATTDEGIIGNTNYKLDFYNKRTIPLPDVELVKVDENDNSVKLNGADFELREGSVDGEVITLDANGKEIAISTGNKEGSAGPDGWYHIGVLPAGTYYMVETNAPEGYLEDETPVIITVAREDDTFEITATKDGQSVITGPDDDGLYTITVDNTLATKYVKVFKYETGTNPEKPLAGAEFTLSYPQGSGVAALTGLTTGADGYLVFDAAEGKKYIELPFDENAYALTETKAPSGYNKMIGTANFSVREDGVTGSGTGYNVTTGTETIDGKSVTVYTIKVQNSAGTELPMTGGPGTTLFTITGSAVLAMAVTYGIASRRRRERGLD